MTRAVLVTVSVLLLVAGGLAVVERASDFTGLCRGGNGVSEGLYDPVVLDGLVTDPLHLAATVDLSDAVPTVGDEVGLEGGPLGQPGVRGKIIALGVAADGELPFTVTPSPEDGLPTLTPGATVQVILRTNAIGKTETISADSLRPRPATLPGPSAVWAGGHTDMGGRPYPHPVVVTQIIGDRALVDDDPADPILSGRTPGTPTGIVVPDHHCRTHGVWPVVLQSPRHWDANSDMVEPW